MYPSGYSQNLFGTHPLRGYDVCFTLLVPMNQKVLKKLAMETILLILINPSCFCEISVLCVSVITYGQLLHSLLSLLSTVWLSLVPGMYNRRSGTQLDELSQLSKSHCSDNRERRLFKYKPIVYIYIYIYITYIGYDILV